MIHTIVRRTLNPAKWLIILFKVRFGICDSRVDQGVLQKGSYLIKVVKICWINLAISLATNYICLDVLLYPKRRILPDFDWTPKFDTNTEELEIRISLE